MEIEIKDKIQNPLLNRTEIHFNCLYEGEKTPKILEVKNKLVAMLNADKKLLVVDKIKPKFGEGRAEGYAKLYDSNDSLGEIETKHIMLKNLEPQAAADSPKEEKPKEEKEIKEDKEPQDK